MRSSRWWQGTVIAASLAGGAEPALAQSQPTAAGQAHGKPALQIWATPENLLPPWVRRRPEANPLPASVPAPAPEPQVLTLKAPSQTPPATVPQPPAAAAAKPAAPAITNAGPTGAYVSRGLVLLEELPASPAKTAATTLPALKPAPRRDEQVIPVAATTAPAAATPVKTSTPRITQPTEQTFPLVVASRPSAKPAAPTITPTSAEVIRPVAASAAATPALIRPLPASTANSPALRPFAATIPVKDSNKKPAPSRAQPPVAVAAATAAPPPAAQKPAPAVAKARLSVPSASGGESTEAQVAKAIRQACPKARDVKVWVTGVNELRIEVGAANIDDANILAGQVFTLPVLEPYGDRVDLQIQVPEP